MAMVGTNAVITSVDVANHYMGGQAILVDVKDPDSDQFGGVFRYTTSGLAWVELQVGNAAAGKDAVGGIYDVLATRSSPKHDGDAQYITLVTNEVDTVLTTKFNGDAWSSLLTDAIVIDGTTVDDCPTSAVIAFPEDYELASNNYIFVGTARPSDYEPGDVVYRVECALSEAVSKV